MNGYSEGYAAFHNSVQRYSNPWAEGLREWRDWFLGWDAAYASVRF